MEDEKCQFNILTCNKKYSVRTASLQETIAWVEAINKEVFGPPLPGIICRLLLCMHTSCTQTHTYMHTHYTESQTNTHRHTQSGKL